MALGTFTPSEEIKKMYVITGKQMNNFKVPLTGDNAYPEDLTILSIELDNITDVSKLFLKKFEVGARWMDDICDNNWSRER